MLLPPGKLLEKKGECDDKRSDKLSTQKSPANRRRFARWTSSLTSMFSAKFRAEASIKSGEQLMPRFVPVAAGEKARGEATSMANCLRKGAAGYYGHQHGTRRTPLARLLCEWPSHLITSPRRKIEYGAVSTVSYSLRDSAATLCSHGEEYWSAMTPTSCS